MVESKVEVLLRVSEVNLARAGKRFDAGEYDSAVFHASMAVESAANAMILDLGGAEARNHRAISGLAAVLRRVKPELLKEERYVQLIERGRELQREVVYARYPLKVAGRWVTPMEYYTREKTMVVIENARFVVDGIKVYLKRTTT
ncbi:HEPN domain-containing protein [Candidatus Bathyarchaeota archaeon]|nr:HEPN domain-containing protein [Candidatus Bathyarchaeota archaeon]